MNLYIIVESIIKLLYMKKSKKVHTHTTTTKRN